MSAGGLWLAVTMMPASASSARTAQASTGVGSGSGISDTRTPAAVRIAADSRANLSELCLASNPTTALGT